MEPGMRPYLPWTVRERLSKISRSHLLRFFQPGMQNTCYIDWHFAGDLIHVDMSEEERNWALRSVNVARKRKRALALSAIALEMPGRTEEALRAFLADHDAGRVNAEPVCIIAGQDQSCMTRFPAKPPSAIPLCRPNFLLNRSMGLPALSSTQLGGYQQVASWAGCSGTVLMIASPSTGVLPGGLYTCIAGSATQTDPSRQRTGLQDPYNRPGELVGMRLDGSQLEARVLDGHKITLSDGRILRSTVSGVVHSDTNSAYVTGGFDGTVAVWSDDEMVLLARLSAETANSPPSAINALAADTRTYGLLWGTSSGEVIWCADPLGSARPALHRLSGPRTVTGQPSPLANSADIAAITSKGKSLAYIGYGFLTQLRTGAVHSWDLSTLQPSDTLKLPHNKALTDMALHPEEHLVALVNGALLDDKASSGDGIVRLYDVRSASSSAQSIHTSQKDMHRVSFSPRSQLIYTNDAATGQMLVHDLRYANRPIWSHCHSPARCEDHQLAFAWLPNTLAGIPDGLLLTGGNDQILRLWDLRRPEPLIEQYDIKHPIDSIQVSTDAAAIWVGTESGSLHLLTRSSSMASLGDSFAITYTRSASPLLS